MKEGSLLKFATDTLVDAPLSKNVAGEDFPLPEGLDVDDVSDGHHTFNELYAFRKMYNAALFNEWSETGKYEVHKSKKHHDGELCFGEGKWFAVFAKLPEGQITNHYKMEDWDLFKIPEEERIRYPFDEHTPQDVLDRLKALTPDA